MVVRVVEPPEPIVTPADIAGDHGADDAKVKALIAAATEAIDGPTGTLGRCLGPQLLEWSSWISCETTRLPFGPVLAVEEVESEDQAGVVSLVDGSTYRLRDEAFIVAPGASWVRHPVHRVRYWAGYGKRDPDDATKWISSVPERARQAIIMAVQHMKALSSENLFLRSDTVEGIGADQFTVSDQAGNIIRDTAKRLLAGLKVPRV